MTYPAIPPYNDAVMIPEEKTFKEENYYQQEFSGFNLAEETVKTVTFEECSFKACIFLQTKFSECRFIACRFNDCTLSAVNPSNTRFDTAVFSGCKVIGIDWTRTQGFRDIVFQNCQLNYSNFRFMKLTKLKMPDCEIIDADFTEADLTAADFHNSNLDKSRFMKTNLTGASFKGAKNYVINPNSNTLKKTKFSYPEVLTLLNNLDIIIE